MADTFLQVTGFDPLIIDNAEVGPPGPAGRDGVTPQLSIGTVNTLPSGSPATAQITGTPEFPTLNLGLPAGPAGPGGGGVGDTGIDGGSATSNTGGIASVDGGSAAGF
jgi:hypothetical protein